MPVVVNEFEAVPDPPPPAARPVSPPAAPPPAPRPGQRAAAERQARWLAARAARVQPC